MENFGRDQPEHRQSLLMPMEPRELSSGKVKIRDQGTCFARRQSNEGMVIS
jgi:hypothetical protein